MNKFPEDSIFLTLKERADLKFHGYQVEKDSNMPVNIETKNGARVLHHHDHVEIEKVDGDIAGIIVADYDAKNTGLEHPYQYIPHLYAIYVKEQYRGRGIASELIHDFMNEIEREKIIVDYMEKVEPFYDQLEHKVIDLRQFKDE